MIRSVLVVVACLVGCAVSSLAAEPLSTRDILSLSKFGKDITSVTWCTDNTLTFVAPSPEDASQPGTRGRAINMLSLVSGASRPVLLFPDLFFRTQCVRGGEFVYVSGHFNVAYLPGEPLSARSIAGRNFNHLIEVLHEGDRSKRREIFNIHKDGSAFDGPVLTDADGNLYGRGSGLGIGLKNINRAATPPNEQRHLTYRPSKNSLDFTVWAVTSNFGNGKHRIKTASGISTPYVTQNIGSYQCPAPGPACPEGSAAKTVVYHTLAPYVTSQVPDSDGLLKGYRAFYTVVPGKNPIIQHWPIIRAYASKHPYELGVVDVAIDAKRCLVLLEPNRWFASSRVAGRLNLDLFIADCRVKDGKLEYSEPHKIGRKQGSFIWPKLDIRGDAVVVKDAFHEGDQEDDQIALEKTEIAKGRICVRLFRGGSAGKLRRVNSLCALVSQINRRTDTLVVSPNAKFIMVDGRAEPLIVGRDYRQDGKGPDWLTNEERVVVIWPVWRVRTEPRAAVGFVVRSKF